MERGKSMAQKRARHYPETKAFFAVAMMLFGVCSAFCLIILWPQQFIPAIFNSRLSRRLIIDDQDYYTCSRDFTAFVISEPDSSYVLYSFYVFTVENTADVVQRGFEPSIVEIGPYGFVKNSYKYDIYFDPEDSLTVTYKEYSYLTEIVDDPDACEAMFYRLERDYLQQDPCADNACKCKSSLSEVTVINPLFLKILWKETPFQLLGHYSVEAFSNIQSILDEPFTEAVKATLVSNAYKEIYQFRLDMQALTLLSTAITTLLSQGYTLDQIANNNNFYSSCGLAAYGVSNYCPFTNIYSTYLQLKTDNSISNYPSLTPFFNGSLPFSFLHKDSLAKWIAISWYYEFLGFNSLSGFTTITRLEIQAYIDAILSQYSQVVYQTSTPTSTQMTALTTGIRAAAKFLGFWVISPTSMYNALNKLVYVEFQTTYEEVICAPTGLTCVWQYGYMREYEHSTMALSDQLTTTIIDISTELSTNPNNFYKDLNAAPFYNAYLYCNNVYHYNTSVNLACTDLGYTYSDGQTNKPAGLWGADFGVSSVNFTALLVQWRRQSASLQNTYFQLSCNLSNLIQRVYRTQTDFHDQYVIRYVNKYQDPDLNYNFTVGNWSDLGIAQWAGGFITQAIMNVRTITQVKRDGMWRIGNRKYYEYLMEYSSWAVLQGYPHAWIYSIPEARLLLSTLARYDEVGIAFRRHIMYRGSTFIGNGSHIINDVGESGDITFMKEVNFADFSCSGVNAAACDILNVFFSSSASACANIAALYKSCTRENLFSDNLWVNSSACTSFETTTTAPTTGIQCNDQFVYGQAHPYRKSRGNIVYLMVYALTLYTTLNAGLWCNSVPTCTYAYGGMFTTTSVRKLLFEGYTEPSILRYYDLKYQMKYSVSFECVNNSYDQCGVKNYLCDSNGIKIKFPIFDSTTNQTVKGSYRDLIMRYGITPNDEFFAPDMIYNRRTNELLWPYAQNETIAAYAANQLALYGSENLTTTTTSNDQTDNNEAVIQFLNPFWQAYAAWNSNDTDFLRYYHCLFRVYNGRPNNFLSCETEVYTGRDTVNKSLVLLKFHGNHSIFPYANSDKGFSLNGSLLNNQYPMYLWDGFLSYPYTYLGSAAGSDHTQLKYPSIFNDLNLMQLTLSQETLVYIFEKQFSINLPLDTGGISYAVPLSFPANVRRFIEDAESWQPYRTMGVSNDSYGKSYQIPIGMAPLQRFAEFPLFAETPHSYGNLLWGGIEYTFVTGTVHNQYGQRTFIDYDPVTGKAIRSANRQQITLRVEASSMFPTAFSSQQRCIVPTKSYALSSGYGCFAYIPLFWYEQASIVNNQSMYQIYDHYYTRPDRAYTLTLAGIVLGCVFVTLGLCLYINEAYHRRRFHSRVYVD